MTNTETNIQPSDKIQGALAVVEFLRAIFEDSPGHRVTREAVLKVLDLTRMDIEEAVDILCLDTGDMGLGEMTDLALVDYIQRAKRGKGNQEDN